MLAPLLLELLNMGAGTPREPPAVTGETLGWYAGDQGVLRFAENRSQGNLHYKRTREARRYFMDFAAVSEFVAGETIVTATVEVASPMLAYDVAIQGSRVTATLYGGRFNTSFAVAFTLVTSGGSIIQRIGVVRVQG